MISVICAVYNAEKWLDRCVNSVLGQTYKDLELLLINDGSTDRSAEICENYARLDSRVKVFHKTNGGVASARQVGIDNMNGDYIIHADADDWMEKDMLKRLWDAALQSNADIAICDFKKYPGGGGISRRFPVH
mgnify:CR=1 FL=1